MIFRLKNDGFVLKMMICSHGPPPDADGEPDEAGETAEAFHWPITKTIAVTDGKELLDKAHQARQVVEALGAAVEVGTGRVDLLAWYVFFYRLVLFSIVLCCFCAKDDRFASSLLKSTEGREVFAAIETKRETNRSFAASDTCNLTGNPKTGGDWIMESDNVDICDMYFASTAEFDGTFAAHASEQSEQVDLVASASEPQAPADVDDDGEASTAAARQQRGIELLLWLTDIRCEKYLAKLVAHGVECVTDMMEVTDGDLTELGMKTLQRRRVIQAAAALDITGSDLSLVRPQLFQGESDPSDFESDSGAAFLDLRLSS